MLASLSVVILLSSVNQAQNRSKKQNQGSKIAASYSTRALNEEVSLASGYLGHDVEGLYNHLRRIIPRKSEFESSEEYLDRAFPQISQSFPNNIPFDSVLTFRVPAKITYDADEQTLEVWVDLSLLRAGTINRYDSDRRAIDLKKRVLSTKTLVGATAFGTKVKYTHTVEEEFGIAFDEDSNLGAHISKKMKMSASLARQVKNNLRVFVTAKIELPLVSSAVTTHEPTITGRRSTVVYHKYLHINPQELWVYDSATGIIYFKIRGNDLIYRQEPLSEEEREQLEADRKVREQQRQAEEARLNQEAVERERTEAIERERVQREKQKIEQGIVDLKILSRPKPRYPATARANRTSGSVILRYFFG